MKSKLPKAEFKQRLAQRTSTPEISIFHLLGFSGKPFRGIFDDSTFALVRNSRWKNARTFEITGEYKASDDNLTEVTYDIAIRKNILILFCVAGVMMVIAITAIYSRNASDALELTGLGILGFLLQIVSLRITRKLVDQRFREEFEIGQESKDEEWERLAGRPGNLK